MVLETNLPDILESIAAQSKTEKSDALTNIKDVFARASQR
jgi:hypothetical protein